MSWIGTKRIAGTVKMGASTAKESRVRNAACAAARLQHNSSSPIQLGSHAGSGQESVEAILRSDYKEVIDGLATLTDEIMGLKKAIKEMTIAEAPIISIEDAAKLVGVKKSRMHNIVSEIKRKTGRSAPFVVNAAGKLGNRIDRERFMEWVRSKRRYPGRPAKARVQSSRT